MTPPTLRMDAQAIHDFLASHFPQAAEAGFQIDAVTPDGVTLRLACGEARLRPGGTVSGPTLMLMADTATFFAILAHIGPEPRAVTSNLEISFLRRPPPGDLIAVSKLLKLGRRLAVAAVTIQHAEDPTPVAHATVTYALPDPAVRP